MTQLTYLSHVSAVRNTKITYVVNVNAGAARVPRGIALLGSFSSPKTNNQNEVI